MSSEDADSLRIHSLSATSDIESIQKMVDDLDLEQGPHHRLELWWWNNAKHLH
jgi:hypothetical protein